MFLWKVYVNGKEVGYVHTYSACLLDAFPTAQRVFGPDAVPFYVEE